MKKHRPRQRPQQRKKPQQKLAPEWGDYARHNRECRRLLAEVMAAEARMSQEDREANPPDGTEEAARLEAIFQICMTLVTAEEIDEQLKLLPPKADYTRIMRTEYKFQLPPPHPEEEESTC